MTDLVIDASVAIKWMTPEPHSEQADRLLAPDFDLFAPDFLLTEVANVMVTKVRLGEAFDVQARDAARQVQKVCVLEPSTPLVPEAITIAFRFGQSVYDSLYLALAFRTGRTLVTADHGLYAGVASLSPGSILWLAEVGRP